jgi:Kdo2-lipid IVA lauroyltransferase/acyltransferase
MRNFDPGSRPLVATLRALQALPFGWQVRLGRGLGALLHLLGRERRRIALRNLELCFPELAPEVRAQLVREHFALLGRSLLERGLLWYGTRERVQGLIRVEGDPGAAERSGRPWMWLVPHFIGLEVVAIAVQLSQKRSIVSVYQRQKSPYLDHVVKAGRLRFGNAQAFPRQAGIRPVIKRIREGAVFFNLPDQDFGAKDAAFVPFFGIPARTLLAPSRLARSLGMAVQPVIVQMLPGGQGWRVEFQPPLADWPTDDPEADTARMNALIEEQIRRDPAQYLWVHKRFKSRPPGAPPLY